MIATAEHIRKIAQHVREATAVEASNYARVMQLRGMDIVSWGEKFFYIPSDSGRPRTIRFLPHQKIIMRLFFDPACAEYFGCEPNFQTLVYSTVKKSGKTAIAALVARWITETWGSHAEVYALANDLEQARGRIYAAALASIELDPDYARADKGILGRWRIIEREAVHLPTHGVLKAVSADYKGEAGSNPVATLWSELWGYTSEASLRLWDELTPVPTRPRSIRYVETYAGYENESSVLNDIEDRMKDTHRSYQVTQADLLALGMEWPWPHEDPLPFYINRAARTVAYWDEGAVARRMPWQTQQYYSTQAETLRPSAFERLHENKRVSPTETFIAKEIYVLRAVDPAKYPLDSKTPIVIGADASVSGDCSAIVAVSRDPEFSAQVMQRLSKIWTPPVHGKLDYSKTIEPAIREWCSKYNVVQIAYDEFQLHDMMTRFRNEGLVWCRKFSQQADRMKADKALYDMIMGNRFRHMGDEELTLHVTQAGAKIPIDDNTRLRIVKTGPKKKIDGAVALSMASDECLRLML